MKDISCLKSDSQITRMPSGYKRSVDQKMLLFSSMYGDASEQTALMKYWNDITNVKIIDSKFSVMIPIHNEERSLASMIESLQMSFIPEGVDMHIDFIFNGCTDRSELIVADFLYSLGNVLTKNISEEEFIYCEDKRLQKRYIEVRRGNIFWRVYETKTIGKANAIKIGSALTLCRGDRILISIDANNYVEPDTIALMFKSAYSHFIIQDDKTVILSAIPKKEYKKETGSIKRMLIEHGVFDDANYITVFGSCMALEPKWVFKNIKFVAVEDYALGVMARSQKRNVAIVEDARIWGYKADFKDNLRKFRRYIRGIFQLLSICPELKYIIASDNYIMRSFPKRIMAIAIGIKSNPKRLHIYLWRFIYGEFGLALGRHDYKRMPDNQSWIGLSSTK